MYNGADNDGWFLFPAPSLYNESTYCEYYIIHRNITVWHLN